MTFWEVNLRKLNLNGLILNVRTLSFNCETFFEARSKYQMDRILKICQISPLLKSVNCQNTDLLDTNVIEDLFISRGLFIISKTKCVMNHGKFRVHSSISVAPTSTFRSLEVVQCSASSQHISLIFRYHKNLNSIKIINSDKCNLSTLDLILLHNHEVEQLKIEFCDLIETGDLSKILSSCKKLLSFTYKSNGFNKPLSNVFHLPNYTRKMNIWSNSLSTTDDVLSLLKNNPQLEVLYTQWGSIDKALVDKYILTNKLNVVYNFADGLLFDMKNN
jgi:hypothetical protein